VDTDGKGIPKDIKFAAKELFANYHIEFDDLQRRPLSKIVTPLPSSEKQKEKELSHLSRTIEKSLYLFENRLNVTAVHASYKVTNFIEQNIPCVTVVVLGKGRVPAGESDIMEIKQLNEYPFDVAEGYYQPANGSSLEAYASPLEGGVGIGVQGVHGAGTLGGFLKDDEGNCYILSNEHVLHPAEAGDNSVIVQPSEMDYDTIHNNASNHLKKLSDKIKKIPGTEKLGLTQEQIDQMNKESRPYMMTKMEQNIRKAEGILVEIESNKPRPIGKYVCGLKDNFEEDFGDNKVKIYVDAAIAKLEEKELSDMASYKILENEANRCPLYGFETDKYWEKRTNKSPTGETINLETFFKQLDTDDSELSFIKIGRTTGFTDEGRIDASVKELYVNIISARRDETYVPKDQPCASVLSHVPFLYCNDCIPPVECERCIVSGVCTKCGRELNNGGEVRSFWAHNCFVVRKRKKPFSDQGDSGALVFDNDGLAWGLVFGTYTDLSKDFAFCLASPLSVTLKALRKKSGKKGLKLWSVEH
jgi:hypothetical protein